MTLGDLLTSVSQLSSTDAWGPPRARGPPRSPHPSVPVPLGPCTPRSPSPSVPIPLGPCLLPRPPSSITEAEGRTLVRGRWSRLSSLHRRVPQVPRPTWKQAWVTEPPQHPPPKHTSLLQKLGLPVNILRGGFLGPRHSGRACERKTVKPHCLLARTLRGCSRNDFASQERCAVRREA